MFENFYKKLSIYRFQIILVVLVVILGATLIFFIISDCYSKFGIIAGGISASLIVALIQLVFSFK